MFWRSAARGAIFCGGAIPWQARCRARSGQVEVVGEHLNLLAKVEYEAVDEIAERIIKAYEDERDGFGVCASTTNSSR